MFLHLTSIVPQNLKCQDLYTYTHLKTFAHKTIFVLSCFVLTTFSRLTKARVPCCILCIIFPAIARKVISRYCTFLPNPSITYELCSTQTNFDNFHILNSTQSLYHEAFFLRKRLYTFLGHLHCFPFDNKVNVVLLMHL